MYNRFVKIDILFFIGMAWLFYVVIISSLGSCGLFTKEAEGDLWNLYYTQSSADETNETYDVFHSGPFEIGEAEEIIWDCISKGQTFRKKYGTIFNFNTLKSEYSILIDLCISISPLLILYYIYTKNKTRKTKY